MTTHNRSRPRCVQLPEEEKDREFLRTLLIAFADVEDGLSDHPTLHISNRDWWVARTLHQFTGVPPKETREGWAWSLCGAGAKLLLGLCGDAIYSPVEIVNARRKIGAEPPASFTWLP